MSSPAENQAGTNGAASVTTYHCGTLTYTKAGLAAMFAWLLWGDFCFTLMETVVPSILPLKLKALGAPNWLMGVILATIPGILNVTICPYVSFRSDRYRSRWGRRIPFITATMPFLCVSLVLLGWSDGLALFCQKHVTALTALAPATVTIGLIALFMCAFQFFNMFVGSVVCYLFNDVVPAQFLAKFLGMFRIVGTMATALYNYFIFQFAETHMREIFLGASLLYLIGFGIMCLMVKEGEYPPVDSEMDQAGRGWTGIKTFVKESFSLKFYWWLFLFQAFLCVAITVYTFNVFFYQNMGLTLDQIGKYGAVTGVAGIFALYFSAIFTDRWHPIRVNAYMTVFFVIVSAMNLVWLFVSLPGNYFFWLFLGSGVIMGFLNTMTLACGLPLVMRMFPQSRFGQFCSAMALVRAAFVMVAGVLSGLFIDVIKGWYGGSDFAYRYIWVWLTVGGIITAFFSLKAYTSWYRLGGDAHFHPPAPWHETGVEELPVVRIVGPQTRWLNLACRIFNAIMVLSVAGLVPLMWWMYHQGAQMAFRWHGILLLPLSVAAWFCWRWVEHGIKRDMRAVRNNTALHNGIPHHGNLMSVAVTFLVALALWITQVVTAVNLHLETGAIAFGIANVTINFLLIGGVWLMCRIERGYSTRLDTFLSLPADDPTATGVPRQAA